MRINGVFPVNSENLLNWHKITIAAAGPIVTILQGLVVFIILKTSGWNKFLYPFLFTTFYMRFLAGLMNFVKLNDEGRISSFLEIGTFTLPIIVSGILYFLVHKISIKYALNLKFQIWTILFVMFFSSLIILFDQSYHIVLIK